MQSEIKENVQGTNRDRKETGTQINDLEHNEEIASLSDTELKILVIRMLTELVEYGHKIEEKVKAMHSEIKENKQGSNSLL